MLPLLLISWWPRRHFGPLSLHDTPLAESCGVFSMVSQVYEKSCLTGATCQHTAWHYSTLTQ